MDLELRPDFYDIIPEFNSEGRLCNYHTGEGTAARVMAEEWERFNILAGRQHEVIKGIVTFNPDLEPCLPDDLIFDQLREVEKRLIEVLDAERIDEACGTTPQIQPFGLSEKDILIQERNRLKQLIK